MALRVVLTYFVVAGLWIVVSDPLLGALVHDKKLLVELSVIKGWAYVVVTALLLYFLLRRETRLWMEERKARSEAEAALRLQNERQRLLLEASRIAWEAAGNEHALSIELMKIIGPHIAADYCFHYRLEADGQHLQLIAGIGLPPKVLDQLQRINLDQAYAGQVAATGKPVIVEARQMATGERGAFGRMLEVKSYAAQPLLSRDGKVLGTLSYASKTREAFSEEEIGMLQIVSVFASPPLNA